MKTLCCTIILFLISIESYTQVVDIPDVNFKNALLTHDPVIDTNGDGEIQISEAENTFEINVSGKSINDLTGISSFSNITYLNCNYNQISNLDLSANVLLESLWCFDNQIINLNLIENLYLKDISCSGNQLTEIDLSNNNQLSFIQCANNLLSTLDVSNNPNLMHLYCWDNELNNIILESNYELDNLICFNNQLASLDIANCPSIYNISAQNNLFETLDFSETNNLKTIRCEDNELLTYINLKNGNNDYIDISGSGQTSRFYDLPNLETVCIDDINSDLAIYIEEEVGHAINFIVTCDIGISESLLNQIYVYPIPSMDIINIYFEENNITQYNIYNSLGEQVQFGKSVQPINEIDISELPKGIYILSLFDKQNRIYSQKFIKI